MSLLQTLKTAQLEARKQRLATTSGLLTTLIGDAVAVGKNDGNREPTDAEVVATIKKFINNTNETITALEGQPESDVQYIAIEKAKAELHVLNFYMPKQMTEAELSEAIDVVIYANSATSIKDMGRVMQTLKSTYGGQYDGSMASVLVKQKLAS